ncbi:MAG: LPS assembly lipoprotein LptE [Pseudomonadota bacterium]|nr:LPS assembly lipoprotein LptE [Pseudomonadota bacterium]
MPLSHLAFPRRLHRALRSILALALLGTLGACGFHLRGDVSYAFTSLYLNAPADNPLTAELRRAMEGATHMRLATAPGSAEVVLDVTAITDEKQVLSLSGGGRVREYLLIKRAMISAHDTNGRDWLPAAEVQVRRSYTFNEAEVLAREAQELRLLKEMQTDAVQQIVRRLQAAKRPLS